MKREFNIGGVHYVQVNKVKARNHYNSGDTVHLIQCNASPHSPWISFCPVSKVNDEGRTFDQHVNKYEYYNCCSQLGKYSHFYIVNDDKRF